VALVPPTADEFLLRYPAFADADTERVQLVLDEAASHVSEDWIPEHQVQAIMVLAAHLLYVDASLQVSIEQGIGSSDSTATAGPISLKSIGPLTLRYGTPGGSSSQGMTTSATVGGLELETSPYGQRFTVLAQMSFPSVLVVI
jgi:hypothetical protein